jgi:hypothetical protein
MTMSTSDSPVLAAALGTPLGGATMTAQHPIAGLKPNITDIKTHLAKLIHPDWAKNFPDGWIEIASAQPNGKLDSAQIFSVFDLESAADFAAAKNLAGFNVYVGVAVRTGAQPRSGRASERHFLASQYAWIEYDVAGDHERVVAIAKAKLLEPAMVIITGTIPNLRAHCYFKTSDITNAADQKSANVALKELFSSDAVQDACRVLRLGGTVNYPSIAKQARGYVVELTTVQAVSEPC